MGAEEEDEDEMGFGVKDKERVVVTAAPDEIIAAIFSESWIFLMLYDLQLLFKIVLDYWNKKEINFGNFLLGIQLLLTLWVLLFFI